MLTELHIENIAVIERADISFSPGLNVLTGETGAGKSIIIDSINAVLGSRTSKELVRRGAENALVSAVFTLEEELPWLLENDIEPDSELILQRKITPEGKSGCRVSGVPVTAAQLRELASCLVDIHGQNDGLRLLDEKAHLSFLDSFAGTQDLLSEFSSEYKKYQAIKREISELSLNDEEKERLSDTLKFRISEIGSAEIKPGEYDELRKRRDLLRNSEKLSESLEEALAFLLGQSEDGALGSCENALYYAGRAAAYAPELEQTVSELSQSLSGLKNAAETLRDFSEALDFSEEEYDRLEQRIAFLEKLFRKYSADEQGLADYLLKAQKKLDDIDYSSDRIIKLKKDLREQKKLCQAAADRLSSARKASALLLQERVASELKDLNMPSVRFLVEFEPLPEALPFDRSGCDSVRFLMSANAGEEPGRISKIASGGELSRIMLALKNVFAENDSVETLIFDEIDTGVSGISGQRVAEKLYSVSKNKQVLCVTHLPQIAAMADEQYLVSKKETSGRTFTSVQRLSASERTGEIARLYGGDNISELTLAAAAEQLAAAESFKNKGETQK